mmetsp:Transcript_52005/g.161728  ORF Transcript_52005/g.161728 Transcript_52005/m.161728 type:complete len:104 (-) Transcript_52005:2-313(-)
MSSLHRKVVEIELLPLVWVLLSCVIGLGISFSGTMCRDVLSATSFDVLGNCNKYLTLAFNSIVLGSSTTPLSLFGVLLALTGGALYSPAGGLLVSRLTAKKKD